MKISCRNIRHGVFDKAPFPCAVICLAGDRGHKRDISSILKEIERERVMELDFQKNKPSDPAYFQKVEPCFQKDTPCVRFQKNEGIILEGDWENYPLQLVEILEYIGKTDMNLVIGISSSFSQLEYNLGVACADKIRAKETIDSNIISHEDDKIYNFIGSMILDFYIKKAYYIKVGKFDRKKKVEGREQFGVVLESSNQYVIKMEERNEEDNNGKSVLC